jgi:2-polyprenyl-3-methyl-5-hydroxy-6-metoxy-1,4-benzoquinol methylase
VLFAAFSQRDVVALQQPSQSTSKTLSVQGLSVHRTPLRRQQQHEEEEEQRQKDGPSPYCFTLSSMLDVPTNSNVLATQVWPSARVAARTLEERILANDSIFLYDLANEDGETEGTNHKFTICELGCGPGLPSLSAAAAAVLAASTQNTKIDFRVIATDLDEFALELVTAAAKEQGLDRIVSTRPLDLIQAGSEDWAREEKNSWMNDVDLFVMSDVFESNAVAVGAARLTQRILSWMENDDDRTKESSRKRKRMWVFAQTDRTQREVYIRELQDNSLSPSSLKWKPPESYDLEDHLWLCDLDETLVDYG